jgi:hypothetical protein
MQYRKIEMIFCDESERSARRILMHCFSIRLLLSEFILGRFTVGILVGTLIILTDTFCVFCQLVRDDVLK